MAKKKTKLSSVPPSDPRIIGSWSIVGGDYPLVNEYRADGMLVQYVGGRKCNAPSPFRIEGEYLIVSVEQDDGSVFEQKDRFTLKGDTLTFIDDEDGSKRAFRRSKQA